MKLIKWIYEKTTGHEAKYYLNYSIGTILMKPLRKWITNSVASSCPFNGVRILLYRLCGFNIGKHVFIGMHSYLDDTCYDLVTIGNNVIISYGVYFACHGAHQDHYPIIIEDDVYIGMRASLISKNVNGTQDGIRIGKGAVIGACALVNRDIPAESTAVGIPCKVVKTATAPQGVSEQTP